MYTNTIIGSTCTYNAINNTDHLHKGMVKSTKPHTTRQPKKSNSKEIPTPSHTRGNSEESPGGGGPPGAPQPTFGSPPVLHLHVLPGLELLERLDSVHISPDKIFSPEVAKIGFTIEGEDGKSLLKCLPSESNNSRSLLFQTLEGRNILEVKTETPYCCSWYKNLEAKIGLPSGETFGTINKTAFGPCKCNRKFMMTCQKNEVEKTQFEVEVVLSPTEFLIKQNDEVVAKVSSNRVEFKTTYKVSFIKPQELNPNLKAMFILFAIVLHIAFAEKINTCFGMCLCCCAGSSVAAWILCLF